MTIGVGGSDIKTELSKLKDMTAGVNPITDAEYKARLEKACGLMVDNDIEAIYLNAGSSLTYFTGTSWHASERMVGAILTKEGILEYIAPYFEISTLESFMVVKGPVNGWQEDESPYDLFANTLKRLGVVSGKVGVDESASFFLFDGMRKSANTYDYVDAKPVTAGCRMCKSDGEIALMQRAKDMTLEVHKSAAKILKAGMSTTEVTAFINEAHKAVGAAGSSFCIVLFGEATAYPHGVKDPQILKDGDMVLIDMGCKLHGYNSDITRTYVFGTPTERQRKVWNDEKTAQLAAFDAAKIGVRCGDADIAARSYLEREGYGPDYAVPGLPHRTGHGIGLDIHEWPYLVRSDDTPLATGMCFSNEPMICIYGEFGVRLEDHFYMTDNGPKWFTEPSYSIDDPFGYEA
ncbi:Xaa-Pro peptidase family protein [Kordiimonas sp. SCSIO 12610]|uniref:M24 family metallopeptidase n=1 Tax=Kordiimonas sp. SCSIO 12610 TaxID=2829597 RepID=UPI002109F920|nr:Xaa-Pro peptidase family protein [Kordiimonas sp. SCSIO 12610]UTW54350.1 aminopeptidase P family protein [Kordiimonas sp. SCSIO 12610]